MKKWEYSSFWYEMRSDTGSPKWRAQMAKAEAQINELGEAGWELVNVSTSYRPETLGAARAWMLLAMFKRARA